MVNTAAPGKKGSRMYYDDLAEKSLQGEVLTRGEMISVLHTPEERLPELLQAAFRVRHYYFGKLDDAHTGRLGPRRYFWNHLIWRLSKDCYKSSPCFFY